MKLRTLLERVDKLKGKDPDLDVLFLCDTDGEELAVLASGAHHVRVDKAAMYEDRWYIGEHFDEKANEVWEEDGIDISSLAKDYIIVEVS